MLDGVAEGVDGRGAAAVQERQVAVDDPGVGAALRLQLVVEVGRELFGLVFFPGGRYNRAAGTMIDSERPSFSASPAAVRA